MSLVFRGPAPDLTKLAIDGERVRLVSLSPRWEEDVFREFTPAIATYMLPKAPESLRDTRAFVRAGLVAMRARREVVLVVTERESGEFLGCCSLHDRLGGRTPEFGIWIKCAAHGRGYGKDAIRTLAGWARTHLEFKAFLYPVDRRNAASRRIPEGMGGRIVGERRETGQSGNELDEVVYRMEPELGA